MLPEDFCARVLITYYYYFNFFSVVEIDLPKIVFNKLADSSNIFTQSQF